MSDLPPTLPHTGGVTGTGRPLSVFRWPVMIGVALLFVLPFLFVRIPPLIDLPGHIGRMAVAAAPAASPLHQYFSFAWVPVLNLGSDLLIEGLRHVMGLLRATWLVCAAVPVITALGVMAVARALNPRGAWALPWALIFVLNWPLFYGFVNYSLAAGLSLLAFALWVRLEARAGLRAALFVVLPALLMLVHAIGGGLSVLMIGSYEIWRRQAWRPSNWRLPLAAELARSLWPLLGVAIALGFWLGFGQAGSGRTVWLLQRKPEAVLMMLRDQNIVLDIASVALALGVLGIGRYWGARIRGGAAGPVVMMVALLLFVPSILTTADQIDTRIAPIIPILALALQDWSEVGFGRRRAIALAGALLLVVRLGVTTAGFIGYERSYASELTALDHVRPGARILNFTSVGCKLSDWNTHRLEHLSNLATPLRDAWVNSHWVIDGVNLIQVRYRPSESYYRDPSEIVFPGRCIDFRTPIDKRSRRTIAETLRRAPINRVDYVWLINEHLPADYAGPALEKRWSNGNSELYAVRSPVPFQAPSP
jgi:hypothetical protein